MVKVILIDPYVRQAKVIDLPPRAMTPHWQERLFAPAVIDGCHEHDFQAVSEFLGISTPLGVDAHTVWTNRERAVLFQGEWESKVGPWQHGRPPDSPPGAGTPGPEQRHCFRLGRPNKAVKATVYYGKSVLVRYVTAVRGVHRTRCAYDDRPELPPAPHATHTPKMPTVEWLEGEPSRFSPPTLFDVAVDLDSGAITQRPSPGRSLCAQCRRNPTLHKLSHCARCMKVSYCSKECQIAHWPLHKQECR